jgi:RNA 2',3'-cyclic 3'-phosphodiesterase
MPRLFVALEIPRDAALSLSLLRGGLPGARWIDVENYHITLRFIGDIDGHVADEVVDGLDRIRRPEFDVALKDVGAFGSKKPHSIWAGVEPSAPLMALQGEIERICQRLRLPADPRKFKPHVTLARLRTARAMDVVPYLTNRANFAARPFRADRFVLLSSRDSVGGGPYVTEEAFPLLAESARQPENGAQLRSW